MPQLAPRFAVRLLGGLAMTALLAQAALAQTLTITDITADAAAPVVMTLPTLEAVDASMDEAAIWALFDASFEPGEAEALRGLDAGAITIPELRIAQKAPDPGHTAPGVLVIGGLAMTNIANGLAGSVEIQTLTFNDGADTTIQLGPLALTGLDVDHLMHLIEMGMNGTGAPEDPRPLLQSLNLEGLSITSEDGTCTLASLGTGAVAMRPMRQLEITETTAKSATDEFAMGQANHFDALTAFETGPMSLQGLDCDVVNDEGHPISLVADSMETGEMVAGRLPELHAAGLRVEDEREGWVAIEALHMHPLDYSGAAAFYEAQRSTPDDGWQLATDRQAVTGFGGFSLSGLSLDVPDQQTPGARVQMSAAYFEVALDRYVGGIPSVVRTNADDIRIVPSAEGGGAEMLAALGIEAIELDYAFAAQWNRAAGTITVENVSIAATDLGTIALAGTLGNARAGLFSADPAEVDEAASHLTLKDLRLEVSDAGMVGALIAMVAAEQNIPPEDFRAALAALVQGTVLVGMAGSPDSFGVAQALAAFVNGAPDLVVTASARAPGGLPLAEIAAAQNNPGELLKRLIFAAESSGEAPPAAEPAAPEAASPPEADPAPDRSMEKTRN